MKFEYKVLETYQVNGLNTPLNYNTSAHALQAAFNDLGEQGWELISLGQKTIFKKIKD